MTGTGKAVAGLRRDAAGDIFRVVCSFLKRVVRSEGLRSREWVFNI